MCTKCQPSILLVKALERVSSIATIPQVTFDSAKYSLLLIMIVAKSKIYKVVEPL